MHVSFPSSSFETSPGRTSISCPTCKFKVVVVSIVCSLKNHNETLNKLLKPHTFKTPLSREPPATPPFKSSTSDPGLLTSNDLIIISRGSEVKSLTGIGILLVMYSQSTSMLYFSCAEMGITGAFSATVPANMYKGKPYQSGP